MTLFEIATAFGLAMTPAASGRAKKQQMAEILHKMRINGRK